MRKIFIFIFVLSIQNICGCDVFMSQGSSSGKPVETFSNNLRSMSAGPRLSDEKVSPCPLKKQVKFCQNERKSSPFGIKIFATDKRKVEACLSKGDRITYEFSEDCIKNNNLQFNVIRHGKTKELAMVGRVGGHVLFNSGDVNYDLEYPEPGRGQFTVKVVRDL